MSEGYFCLLYTIAEHTICAATFTQEPSVIVSDNALMTTPHRPIPNVHHDWRLVYQTTWCYDELLIATVSVLLVIARLGGGGASGTTDVDPR
jgi:hypothetical protein